MDATGVLAPMLVLATVVERVLEVLWTWWEGVAVKAKETLIERGDDQAEKDKLARDPDYVRKLLLDNPTYKESKRLLTLVAGSLLGMFLAVVTGVRFFQMTFAALQMPQPSVYAGTHDIIPLFDVLITGLILGAGSQPAHAIINWVQFAQSVQKELQGLRQGDLTLQDSQILNQILANLGLPQDTIASVMKLMLQHGVRSLADLLNALKSDGSRATAADITAVENLEAAKAYLDMTGRADLVRLLP
jgi:hypothetical protein